MKRHGGKIRRRLYTQRGKPGLWGCFCPVSFPSGTRGSEAEKYLATLGCGKPLCAWAWNSHQNAAIKDETEISHPHIGCLSPSGQLNSPETSISESALDCLWNPASDKSKIKSYLELENFNSGHSFTSFPLPSLHPLQGYFPLYPHAFCKVPSILNSKERLYLNN